MIYIKLDSEYNRMQNLNKWIYTIIFVCQIMLI